MKLNRIFLLLPLLLLTFCQKDPIIDEGNTLGLLKSEDSTSFVSYTILNESNDALNENDVPLGILNDPRFGSVSTSFYTQLRLTTISFEPGTTTTVDSAFLELVIESAFGPLTSAMDIEVYRLEEAIDNETEYSTEVDLLVGSTLLGSLSYTYQDGDASVRIPIETAFSNELFSLFGSASTESNDDFLAYLDGIYVKVKDNTGGDGHLDLSLTDSESALKLYYNSDTAYAYLMDEQAIRINKYDHDLVGSELEAAINNTTNDDSDLLLGGLNTSFARINLPDLSALQGSIINQAKLTFYQSDYGDALNVGYDLPEYLFLSGGINGDTLQYLLTDYSSSNPLAYGGTSELVTIGGNTTNAYSYNLPRFIQKVVNEDTGLEFLTLEVLNFNNGNRIQLGGGSHPTLPIKLEILYTKP